MNRILGDTIKSNAEDIRKFDVGLTDLLMNKATGEPYKEGELLKYPKLAETLKMIADDEQGVHEFYQGKIAHNLVSDIKEGGA